MSLVRKLFWFFNQPFFTLFLICLHMRNLLRLLTHYLAHRKSYIRSQTKKKKGAQRINYLLCRINYYIPFIKSIVTYVNRRRLFFFFFLSKFKVLYKSLFSPLFTFFFFPFAFPSYFFFFFNSLKAIVNLASHKTSSLNSATT